MSLCVALSISQYSQCTVCCATLLCCTPTYSPEQYQLPGMIVVLHISQFFPSCLSCPYLSQRTSLKWWNFQFSMRIFARTGTGNRNWPHASLVMTLVASSPTSTPAQQRASLSRLSRDHGVAHGKAIAAFSFPLKGNNIIKLYSSRSLEPLIDRGIVSYLDRRYLKRTHNSSTVLIVSLIVVSSISMILTVVSY